MSTHNRSEVFLPRAIESVINQSYKNWELIIADDCSTDDTDEVVKSYQKKDPRIKYIRLKKNFGNDTRPKNLAIKESVGEYLAFLDDDNAWRTDHLASLYSAITHNKGVSLVYCDRYCIPSEQMMKPVEEGGEGLKPGIGSNSDFNPALLIQKNYIDTSDVLVKRQDIVDIGGFDESIRKFIDWNLWVRLMKTGKTFMRVPQLLTDYYLHDKMKAVTNTEGQFNTQTGLFTPTFDPVNCKIHSGCIGKPSRQKIAFFTLLFNRLDYTKQMLKSVIKTTKIAIDKWVFVDQGSNDGTLEYMIDFALEHQIPIKFVKGVGKSKLPKIPKVNKNENKTIFKQWIIILNDENTGIPFASNQAVEAIKPTSVDYIMKLDNDAIFLSNGWLEGMMNIYDRNEMFILSPYVEGIHAMPGGMPRRTYGTIADEYLGMVDHLGGICVIAPAKVYYNWSWPDAFMQGGNDVMFSNYVQKCGYLMAYMENSRVEHIHGTRQQEKDYPEYYKAKEILRRTRYNAK